MERKSFPWDETSDQDGARQKQNLKLEPWRSSFEQCIDYNRESQRSKAAGFPERLPATLPDRAGSLEGGAVVLARGCALARCRDRVAAGQVRVVDLLPGAGVRLVAALSDATWYNIGLAVVVVALVFAGVLAYRVYREVNEDVEPATPEELLASFEQARSEGELDEEEYQRVRRQFETSLPRPPVPSARRKGGPPD